MDLIQIRKIYRIGNGMGKYLDLCNLCQSLMYNEPVNPTIGVPLKPIPLQ